MVDLVTIQVKAGDGGDGAVAFTTDIYRPKGPPSGGDGGRGGDIILVADQSVRTLLDFHYKSSFAAKDGKRGAENHKKGEQGEDLRLKVPIGTVARLVGELTLANQTLTIARGGRGGHGNAHLKTSDLTKGFSQEEYYQALQQAESGQLGEARELTLELKLVADVGIIGFPNAGKSTLLSVLTAAHPKIADYPFTTLEPNLGVMQIGKTSLTLADIPGLIEGASSGRGLGLEFLRHVERTKVLLHLISAENSDLRQAYQAVRKELNAYSIELSKKEELVVMSKLDILAPEERKLKIRELKQIAKNALTISAVTSEGIENLRDQLAKLLQE